MIKNSNDKQFIEKASKDIEENRFHGTNLALLEMIYDLGVKEGKSLVVKNAVEFISR